MPVTVTIQSEGVEISGEYHVLYIDITKEANRIPTAVLRLRDGNSALAKYEISDESYFNPGKKITILARRGDEADKVIFEGIVVKHNIKSKALGSFLTLELRNVAHKLTYPRKSLVYNGITDSGLIKEIIKLNGLTLDDNEAGNGQGDYEHKEIVQYYCSDWDFMLSRADANGLIVFVDDTGLRIKIYNGFAGTVHTIKNGLGAVLDFEMEIDAYQQYGEVSSVNWDIEKQAYSTAQDAADFTIEQGGDLTGSGIAQTIGIDACTLVNATPMEQEEAASWANAQMIKSRIAMVRGYIRIQGTSNIVLGDTLVLEGFSDKFNGKAMVTGVRHEIEQQSWHTYIQFGMCGEWFTKDRDKDITDTPAAGLLPAVNGLQVAVIESLDDSLDPLSQNRIQVKVPAISNTDGIIWARFASPYAGNETGMLFRPEVGDEVVVGFLNDDPRQAIILGSMYSSANTMPVTLDENNFIKSITTKGGLSMTFDDENQAIVVMPNANTYMMLHEGEQMIEIVDANNKNTITLDSKGVTIKSAKGLTFESDGDITLTSGGAITLDGSTVETL